MCSGCKFIGDGVSQLWSGLTPAQMTYTVVIKDIAFHRMFDLMNSED
jgi:hypothetical protein